MKEFYWGTSISQHFGWGICGFFVIFNGVIFSYKIPVGRVIFLLGWKIRPFSEIFLTGMTSGWIPLGHRGRGVLELGFCSSSSEKSFLYTTYGFLEVCNSDCIRMFFNFRYFWENKFTWGLGCSIPYDNPDVFNLSSRRKLIVLLAPISP